MNRGVRFLTALAVFCFSQFTGVYADWIERRVVDGTSTRVISVSERGGASALVESQVLRSIPYYWPEHEAPSRERYEEILHPGTLPQDLIRYLLQAPIENSEVRTLIDQGPPSNRICLTILGDGYTEQEKDRFFEDANRITRDLFQGSTFQNYLPLFNVYAIFTPSRESGISDRTRKDTVFGLYRSPAGSKRAIMPGNTSLMERTLRLAPKTDYPIVLANDDFYGGLGGRFAITTRSVQSGSVVLRHELGHNFGEVGEEYDNGYVYNGANSSRSGTQPSWRHWAATSISPQESVQLTGDYVWQELRSRPYRAQFNTQSLPIDFKFSGVGWAQPNTVSVLLDGSALEFTGVYSEDRGFYKTSLNRTLAPGRHTLEVIQRDSHANAVLAYALAHAYPENYSFEESIQAYATYDNNGAKSYRPTHDHCIMRDMERTNFCAPDRENFWRKFLSRVRLMDRIERTSLGASREQFTAVTPALSGLSFRWSWRRSDGSQGGTEWSTTSTLELTDGAPVSSVSVETRLNHPEIRDASIRVGAREEWHRESDFSLN